MKSETKEKSKDLFHKGLMLCTILGLSQRLKELTFHWPRRGGKANDQLFQTLLSSIMKTKP